jgi:hypothetical protein
MENWDGKERRSSSNFCSQHITAVADMAVIKNSLANIEKTIVQGTTFKTTIVTSLIGVLITLVIQIATFSYLYGQAQNQIKVNTERLNKIESLFIINK